MSDATDNQAAPAKPAFPPAPADAAAEKAWDQIKRAPMRNRYAGRCECCRHLVDEGVGVLRHDANGFHLFHDECEPLRDGEPGPMHVDDGYYAVPSRGSNDLEFFRVGGTNYRPHVEQIIGGHPNRTVFGRRSADVYRRIAETPGGAIEAAKLYGREIGRCGRCNRSLTDQNSRALGLGPECAQKV